MFEQLELSLIQLGIKDDDNLIIHSDLSFLKTSNVKYKEVFGSFFNLTSNLVKNGNILIPAFNYDFCKTGIFDVNNSPSQTGMFANYLIKNQLSRRTMHPIFSFVIYGKDSNIISKNISTDAFGNGSIFSKMHKEYYSKILFVNADFQNCTYCHYVEQKNGIDYRLLKKFPGKIIDKKNEYIDDFTYFVRPLDGTVITDLKRLEQLLLLENALKQTRINNIILSIIAVNDFVNITENALKRNKYFLLSKNPN